MIEPNCSNPTPQLNGPITRFDCLIAPARIVQTPFLTLEANMIRCTKRQSGEKTRCPPVETQR